MKNRFLISGWYGFGNLGDEVILSGIAASIEQVIPDAKITCLSFKPSFTKSYQGIDAVWQLPAGIRGWVGSLVRLRLFSTLAAFIRCDLLILGGGGFLSDWQPEAPWIWLRQALLARLLGKRVMLYGIGAGPFTRPFGKWLTSRIINTCVHAVTVRDEESRDELLKAGVLPELITVTADPALAFPLSRSSRKLGNQIRVGFCLAPIFHLEELWPGKKEKYIRFIQEITQAVDELGKQGFCISFIPMQESVDMLVAKNIQDGLSFHLEVTTLPNRIDEAAGLLGQIDILVAMRLHAGVLGAIQGTPVVGIIYHHKVNEFVKAIGLEDLASELGDGGNWRDADIDSSRIVAAIHHVVANYDGIQARLRENISILRDRQNENTNVLIRVLGRTE